MFVIFQLTGCKEPVETEETIALNKILEDAYQLCEILESTDLTTACEVRGWAMTVDVKINTTGEEATEICAGIVEKLARNSTNFAGKWRLYIFSPFDSDDPLAICTLP